MLIKIKQLVWKKLENYLIKKGMIENHRRKRNRKFNTKI